MYFGERFSCISSYSYIKPQPTYGCPCLSRSCISSYSYIKPQRFPHHVKLILVVYHPIPTSNHNLFFAPSSSCALYIILFLHQTTTGSRFKVSSSRLYIILFLHQTTTTSTAPISCARCISSYSYIKPQRAHSELHRRKVVYHPIPTSNHNHCLVPETVDGVVYHPIPTSNHNSSIQTATAEFVVYHPIPTSNHNTLSLSNTVTPLYIILFLHQTTTAAVVNSASAGCISSYSYIKPQPRLVYSLYIKHLHPFSRLRSGNMRRIVGKNTKKIPIARALLALFSSFLYPKS